MTQRTFYNTRVSPRRRVHRPRRLCEEVRYAARPVYVGHASHYPSRPMDLGDEFVKLPSSASQNGRQSRVSPCNGLYFLASQILASQLELKSQVFQ